MKKYLLIIIDCIIYCDKLKNNFDFITFFDKEEIVLIKILFYNYIVCIFINLFINYLISIEKNCKKL